MERRMIAFLICGVLLFSAIDGGIGFTALAVDNEEEKVYSNATIDDAFADNYIMVVLNNQASLEYLQTEKADFLGLEAASVESFTSPRGKQVKAMMDERSNASLTERMLTSDPNAEEIANYREVLCIELAERGKDKVLEAIALLENWMRCYMLDQIM